MCRHITSILVWLCPCNSLLTKSLYNSTALQKDLKKYNFPILYNWRQSMIKFYNYLSPQKFCITYTVKLRPLSFFATISNTKYEKKGKTKLLSSRCQCNQGGSGQWWIDGSWWIIGQLSNDGVIAWWLWWVFLCTNSFWLLNHDKQQGGCTSLKKRWPVNAWWCRTARCFGLLFEPNWFNWTRYITSHRKHYGHAY